MAIGPNFNEYRIPLFGKMLGTPTKNLDIARSLCRHFFDHVSADCFILAVMADSNHPISKVYFSFIFIVHKFSKEPSTNYFGIKSLIWLFSG